MSSTSTINEGSSLIAHNYDLAIAEVVIFAFLFLPLPLILIKSKWGTIQYLYLGVYCILQIVGSALIIKAGKYTQPGTAAFIVSNVGTAPLLFASFGLLVEATKASSLKISSNLSFLLDLIFHVVVIIGIGMFAVGLGFAIGGTTSNWPFDVAKVGSIILCVSWAFALLCAVAAFSQLLKFHSTRPIAMAAIVSIPLVGIRILYSTALIFDNPLKLVTSSIALRICLTIIEGMIIVFLFVVAGIICLGRDDPQQPEPLYYNMKNQERDNSQGSAPNQAAHYR